MYHILDQTNIEQSFAYDALIGPYISTIMHDKKFIRVENGPWMEMHPVFPNNDYPWHKAHQHQASSSPFNQTQATPKQSPKSPHSTFSQAQTPHRNFTPAQHTPEPNLKSTYSNLPSPHTRHYVPGMTEEELEERRKEAGWYPGCESEEEEEEPDFWEFIKNLEKETEERMADSLRELEEENENYFIARFDYH